MNKKMIKTAFEVESEPLLLLSIPIEAAWQKKKKNNNWKPRLKQENLHFRNYTHGYVNYEKQQFRQERRMTSLNNEIALTRGDLSSR